MSRLLPPVALAISLNGFFLYLGALDAIDRSPRTLTTGAWYALVGLLCLAGAWLRRDRLLERLRRRPRPTAAFVVASSLLAVWFLLNVLLLSEGSLARTLAALLILWTLPTTLLALSLAPEDLEPAAVAIAFLAAVFVAIECVALARNHDATRFSPIAKLDPISAAQIPALGAVALLALGRRRLADAGAIAAFVAATVLPGSRGPVLALAFAALLILVLTWRRSWRVAVPALAAGVLLGAAATAVIGTDRYLTEPVSSVGGVGSSDETPAVKPEPEPISTFSIRRQWWTSAAKAVPDEPIVGHGVAMFVDDTPEAHRMGVAGKRTYPHNSPLESLYSLGLLGAIPYAVFLLAALLALARLARRTYGAAIPIAVGLYAFAFVGANLSGEIGADAALWSAGALAVAFYADRATAAR